MNLPRRTWGAALCAVFVSACAGWASCALPGYTLGDAGGAQGGGGSSPAASSSSGVGGAGSSSSSSGAGGKVDVGAGGGGGGVIECTVDEPCNQFDSICTDGFCDLMTTPGKCALTHTSDAATDIKPKATGDCSSVVCLNGLPKKVANNEDVDIDSDPCTKDECIGGVVVHAPNDGAPCDLAAGTLGTCAAGKCVQCSANVACNGATVCVLGKCVPTACKNGMKDGAETDKDCGGAECPPCPNNFNCGVPEDCLSKVCTGQCAAPTCSDGVQNGEEPYKDCGSTCPNKCAPGKPCRFANDCADGVCRAGFCQAPSCDDWVQNQGEDGIDCGPICQIGCP